MFAFAARVAWRFLKNSRSQTIFILLGITVGVSIQIFLSSLISGLQANLVERTVGDAPHIIIAPQDRTPSSIIGLQGKVVSSLLASPTKEEAKIPSWQPLTDTIDQIEQLRVVSPLVEGQGVVRKGERSRTIVVKGVILERADQIYELRERVLDGIPILGGNSVLVGKELAEDLQLKVSDLLEITTPNGKARNFIVNGVFDLQNQNINSTWVFLDLPLAQTIFNLEGAISFVEIQIDEVFQSEKIAARLKQEFPDYTIETWQTRNQQLLSALRSQSLSSYMIQFFILLAVTLGIASVLVVSVSQKIREIGILKAIGTTNTGVSFIFLIQGAILGLFGSSLGALAGISLIRLFQRAAAASGGAISFTITTNPRSLLLIVIISTLASLFAAISPARQAIKLVPIEVIRNG